MGSCWTDLQLHAWQAACRQRLDLVYVFDRAQEGFQCFCILRYLLHICHMQDN